MRKRFTARVEETGTGQRKTARTGLSLPVGFVNAQPIGTSSYIISIDFYERVEYQGYCVSGLFIDLMFGLKRSGLTVELHGPALRKDMMLFGEMRKKMWRGILMPRSLYNRGLCKTNMLYNRLDFYDKAKARG